jgi:integrase
MVPAVRCVLETLPSRRASGNVFGRPDGRMVARSTMEDAWYRTLRASGVRRIRLYDLRHTFASLLIAAGKNPPYIARQMGHHSAGFTLDTYGHLMEHIPARPVEWIDELVFPEGFAAALNCTCWALYRVQTCTIRCKSPDAVDPWKIWLSVAWR